MSLPLREVIPTELFHDGPFRWRVATRALAHEGWLQPDPVSRDEELAEKARILDASLDAFVCAPGSDEACAEVRDLVGMAIGVPLAEMPGHPLEVAARQVHEDLVVMQRRAGEWVMTAGVVCFPTRWNPAAKIGQSMATIHGPVPRYGEIEAAVDRLFDRLQPGRIAWRPNWSVVGDPALRLEPHDRQAPRDLPADPDRQLWLRVERQTVRRLERTADSVVFTIRVHRWPLAEVLTEIDAALAAELRALPDDVAAYKNLDGWRHRLADHLTERG